MAFKHLKLSDIADQAPGYGVDSLEARPARTALGAERIGLTAYRVKPGRGVGFGHSHDTVEEVYLVTSGRGRFKVDEEIVEVGPGEVVYCPPQVVREWEAGEDGLEVVAFGGHAEGDGTCSPAGGPTEPGRVLRARAGRGRGHRRRRSRRAGASASGPR